RAGRRCYNPGLGLFRKVLESNIRDPKEERRLVEDPGLSNSKQPVENRIFQVGGNNRHSSNNNAQRLGHYNRPASSLPPHQSSRRDATVTIFQLQWSLLFLQRKAVWSFNGPENLYQMPPTSDSIGQGAMQLENLHLRRRYSDPELGSHNITSLNITSNEHPTRVWLDDRNGQEPDLSHAYNVMGTQFRIRISSTQMKILELHRSLAYAIACWRHLVK
ncbi:MAG: hypothetical protein EZS28_054822, partial [Streblomastix strix]